VTGVGRAPRGVGTTNPEAHDLYLLGQELVRHRGRALTQGIDRLKQAIELDSNYAQAYAALARALSIYPYFNGTPPSEIDGEIKTYAARALAIDSTLADAHTALAQTEMTVGRYDRVRAEFRHAIALEPDNVEARLGYARFLIEFGSTRDALVELDSARRVDPLSPVLTAWEAYALYIEGRTDSALVAVDRATQLGPNLLPVLNLGSAVQLGTGHREEARRLALVSLPVTAMSNAPAVLAALGDTATAMRMIRELEANTPRPWFTDVSKATVLLAIGDTASALRVLDALQDSSGPSWVQFLPIRDAVYDPVRGSPHFAKLLERANVDLSVALVPRAGRANK
jgi:tetratricopeptide (TPR) repeat protein